MALSGTINGSVTKNSNHFSFYATWSATQNVEGNYSDVTVRSYWKCVNTSYYTFDTVGTRAASITVSTSAGTLGSETISKRFDLAPWPSNPYLIQTLTVRVQHSADGSAPEINITARANGTASSYGPSSSTSSSGDCVASDFVTLDTIPRASKPTLGATSINLGSSVSIYTNAASSAFRHKIYYNWYSTTNGSPNWINIGQGVEDELLWTLPLTFANNLPGTTKGYGTIRCETYNGSTLIGTKDVTFEGVVPNTAEFRPKCAIEVTDPTGYAAQYGSFVKGLSKFHIKVTPTLAYGSPILRYTVLANGQSYNEAEVTTGVVAELQGTIQATVTDERGRTSTLASEPYTALDYVKPTISALTVHRCDANGTENDQGDYVQATFSAAVAPLNSLNSAKYVLRYTIMGDGSATTTEVELTALAGRYQVTDYTAAPFAADGNSTYSVELAVTDDISTTTRATSVSTAFTLMNWGPEGRSMAIGKVAEKPGTLEVALDLETSGDASFGGSSTFSGPVTFTGEVSGAVPDMADYPVATGTTAMGTNGTWYWTKWKSGRAECYGCRNYGNMGVSKQYEGVLYASDTFAQGLPDGLFVATPEIIDIQFRNAGTTFSEAMIVKGYPSLPLSTVEVSPSKTTTGSFFVARWASATLSQVYLSFNIIGRWK